MRGLIIPTPEKTSYNDRNLHTLEIRVLCGTSKCVCTQTKKGSCRRRSESQFTHTQITHLLRSCSRSEKVSKTLSELLRILNVVMVQRLISRLQSDLVQQSHTIHNNVHTAPKPWWLKGVDIKGDDTGITGINWFRQLHCFCCVKPIHKVYHVRCMQTMAGYRVLWCMQTTAGDNDYLSPL